MTQIGDARAKTTLRKDRRTCARPALAIGLAALGALGLACGRTDQNGAGPGPEPADGELSQAAADALGGALESYDAVRSLLAEDRQDGLAEAAATLARDLRAARRELPADDASFATDLDQAASAADRLDAASDLAESRTAFGEVSRHLLPVATADARLRAGRHLFECPMTKTFPRWLQASEEVANPYMGADMSTCGERAAWPEETPGSGGG